MAQHLKESKTDVGVVAFWVIMIIALLTIIIGAGMSIYHDVIKVEPIKYYYIEISGGALQGNQSVIATEAEIGCNGVLRLREANEGNLIWVSNNYIIRKMTDEQVKLYKDFTAAQKIKNNIFMKPETEKKDPDKETHTPTPAPTIPFQFTPQMLIKT